MAAMVRVYPALITIAVQGPGGIVGAMRARLRKDLYLPLTYPPLSGNPARPEAG
jgi:hypothetical protein